MNKMLLAGAITLGLSVFFLLGAFGVGSDTAGEVLIELGVPERWSDKGSRMFSGLLLSIAIVLQVLGWKSAMDDRVVTHEEFMAAKKFVEHQEKKF